MFQNVFPDFKVQAGIRLADLPRFNLRGKALLVGPYDSAESHELHMTQTYGSGDPFLDTTDEIRFSPDGSRLVSCRIGVPERPTRDRRFAASCAALPAEEGLPVLQTRTPFQVVIATHTHIDPAGRALHVFDSRAAAPSSILHIAPDLDMIVGQRSIAGFVLHHPAQYLTTGWAKCRPLDDDTALGPLLASYVNLLDEGFIARMDDGDPTARDAIVDLLDAVKRVEPSGQRDVVLDALETMLETFW